MSSKPLLVAIGELIHQSYKENHKNYKEKLNTFKISKKDIINVLLRINIVLLLFTQFVIKSGLRDDRGSFKVFVCIVCNILIIKGYYIFESFFIMTMITIFCDYLDYSSYSYRESHDTYYFIQSVLYFGTLVILYIIEQKIEIKDKLILVLNFINKVVNKSINFIISLL